MGAGRDKVKRDARGGKAYGWPPSHSPRSRATHQFDSGSRPGSARQPTVAREKHSIQGLGKRDVCRIVGAEILAKLPNPIEQGFVRMSLQAEPTKIVKRRRCSRRVEFPVACVTPKRLYDLHIEKVWGVQSKLRVGNPSGNGVTGRGVEQELHDGRSVDYDHRESRSARITSAALRFKCRRGRARKRSITSWRVGQSSAFPTSRRT